jgi:translocator protein
MFRNGFRWWHAVVIFVAANVASGVPAGFNGDEAFYNQFVRPSVAPPDWLFPPVWLFLNVTSLIALYRVANSPRSAARTGFLISEGVGWVLFAAFATLFFVLRSPVLGAANTVLGLLVAVVSLALAVRLDRQACVHIAFRVLWLALASYVSVWMALNNPDEFLSARSAE